MRLGLGPIALLIAAWLLPGLFGHDPWKPDEAYTFGLVYHVLETGDWLVPTLGGEPFVEKPPIFFWTAAFFAKLFGWAMPLHDAAHLASAFYVVVTLVFTGLAARRLYGASAALQRCCSSPDRSATCSMRTSSSPTTRSWPASRWASTASPRRAASGSAPVPA